MSIAIAVDNPHFDSLQTNKDLRRTGLVEEFKKDLYEQNQEAANTFSALVKYGYKNEIYKIFADSLGSALSVDLRKLGELGIKDTRHPSLEAVKRFFTVALPNTVERDSFFLNAFNDSNMLSLISEQIANKIKSPSFSFSNMDEIINLSREVKDNLTGINSRKVLTNETLLSAVTENLFIPLSDLEEASKIYSNICEIFPRDVVEQIFNDKNVLNNFITQMSEDYHFCQSQEVYDFLKSCNVKVENLFNAVLESKSNFQWHDKYQRRMFIIRSLSTLVAPEELKATLIEGSTLKKMKENYCDAMIETNMDGVDACTTGIKLMLNKLRKLVADSAPESINGVASPFFGKTLFGKFVYDPYVYGRVKDAMIAAASQGDIAYIKKMKSLLVFSFLDKMSNRILSSKDFIEAIMEGHSKVSKRILAGEASSVRTLKKLDAYIKSYTDARGIRIANNKMKKTKSE